MSAALPPVVGAQQPPPIPIRLPSYKELAALSQCDLDAPIPRTAKTPTAFPKTLLLPPLKVPSRPLRDDKSSGDSSAAGSGARDRFLDLARHCPAAPSGEWSPYPGPASAVSASTPASSAYRPSPASAVSSSASSLPPMNIPRLSPPQLQPHTLSPHPHGHHHHHHAHSPMHLPSPASSLASPYPSSVPPSAYPTPISASSPYGHGHGHHLGVLSDAMDIDSANKLKFSHTTASASAKAGTGGRAKKQALSCYFCRERKIACGRPPEGTGDERCNQCARRKISCTYPTVSHRGQHSRLKSAARKAQGDGYDGGLSVDRDAPARRHSSSPSSTSASASVSGGHSPSHDDRDRDRERQMQIQIQIPPPPQAHYASSSARS